ELYVGIVFYGYALDIRTKLLHDFMALYAPVFLVYQVNLYVGHIVAASKIIVADKSVETYRRGSTHITLVACYQFLFRDILRDLACHRRRAFQGGSFRHIDYNLKFILVVEGKHLDRHPLCIEKGDRPQQDYKSTQDECPPFPPGFQKWIDE